MVDGRVSAWLGLAVRRVRRGLLLLLRLLLHWSLSAGRMDKSGWSDSGDCCGDGGAMERSDRSDEERMAADERWHRLLPSRRAAAEAEGKRATRPAQWPSQRFGLGLWPDGFSRFGDNENNRTAHLERNKRRQSIGIWMIYLLAFMATL